MVTYDENLLQAEQKKIEQVYSKIGERYYAAHKDDKNCEFPDLMDEIKTCEQTMADHKAEVLRQQELMLCPACGAEIYFKSFFCNFCGTRVAYPEGQKPAEPEVEPEVQPEPEPEPAVVPVTEEVKDAPVVRTCKSCGYVVTDPEARFCDNCGVPLGGAAPAPAPAAKEKRCPRCGFTSTDPDVLFCIECGHRLEQ